jgi:hypothetical protein
MRVRQPVPAGGQVNTEAHEFCSVAPAQFENFIWRVTELELPCECRVGVAQADEVLEPGHDRAGQSNIDLAASVMMAINVATDSRLSKQRQIIYARQQSYVVDLRNAREKKLHGSG